MPGHSLIRRSSTASPAAARTAAPAPRRSDSETRFEELGEQSPLQRFQRLMAKDSRRYELLLFAVEACYLLIFLGYFILIGLNPAAQSKGRSHDDSSKPPPPKPHMPELGKNKKSYEFYSSCVDDLWAQNYARMSSIEEEAKFKDSLGMAVDLTHWCRAEALGEDSISDFFAAFQLNNIVPAIFVILRLCRLYCCNERLVAYFKIKATTCRVLDTLFHTLVLSWYGAMAGLFSVMSLISAGGEQSAKFLESLYIGPSVYVFLLTVSCLTVLDVRQTVIASTISYICFAIPSLTSLFIFMDKLDCGVWKLMVLDHAMLLFAIIAVCYARYSSWRDRAVDFKRTDELMLRIINEKVMRCAAEFTAEQLQASRRRKPSDGQETDYLGVPENLLADPSTTSAAAMWPSPPSCQSAPADMEKLAFLEKGGEPRCDCLPLSAKVYLSGAAGSTAASELLEGDQVLCYDHLAGSIKYVEVEDVGTETGECEWSHMVMADGTRVSVTADHPVRVVGQTPELPEAETRGAWGLGGGRVSSAGNLRAGKDMLKLLRLGAVPVADIHTEIVTAPRVRVNLKQSWRYSLFCSQSTGLEMTAVAVESSNALEGRARDDVKIKHGFFHGAAEQEVFISAKKPKSAPDRLMTANVLEPGESDIGTTKETMTTQENARDRGSGSSTDARSSDEKEDLTEPPSEEAQDELHAKGQCQPCLFQYRHQTDPNKYAKCMKADCLDRNCHEIHTEEYIHHFKAAKRKYEKRNRLSYRKVTGQIEGTLTKIEI